MTPDFVDNRHFVSAGATAARLQVTLATFERLNDPVNLEVVVVRSQSFVEVLGAVTEDVVVVRSVVKQVDRHSGLGVGSSLLKTSFEGVADVVIRVRRRAIDVALNV